ncbi:MAG: aminotransferase class V-fold PLP-dependent enzyme [Acidobacteria bacterium]|nr:aminotransferase class V-fold PLP-dependent enzyme [Acidobacteriota bacterium]
MIYLDHAATSWPKPPEVLRAMAAFLERAGGNPGRSGHRLSLEAGRIVYDAREAVASLFGAPDPLRVLFTLNATQALNLALSGLLGPGDHVVATGMEHNAVMRPLRHLESGGVRLTVVPCSRDGSLDPGRMAAAIGPSTRLVVMTHASNVTGTILPVSDVARAAHARGALLLVDAAQTAGVLPIDMQLTGIDLLAFTGHKGLQGPPGTGGLILGEGVPASRMAPLVRGGTGSRSEHEIQPEDFPDKFESGTLNGPGIAGLGAGIRWVLDRGIDALRARELELARALAEGIRNIAGVAVYGPENPEERTSIVSFTAAGRRPSEIGLRLDDEFGILCRVGLHCAPAAHRTIGTFPEGTVRLALGAATGMAEVEAAVAAVRKVLRA